MGYRSCGAIYLSDEALKILPDELKKDLENWDKYSDNIYEFSDWKWYEDYPDVDMWNKFYEENKEDGLVDFVVVGEDNAVVVEPQFQYLGYSMTIDIY